MQLKCSAVTEETRDCGKPQAHSSNEFFRAEAEPIRFPFSCELRGLQDDVGIIHLFVFATLLKGCRGTENLAGLTSERNESFKPPARFFLEQGNLLRSQSLHF